MSEKVWSAVDGYIADLFLCDPVLDVVLAASKAAGLPQINVSAAQGKLLWLLAKAHGAKRILEIGTLGGFSAIWLARALPADGVLITLEFDPKHAATARANIARAGLAERVTVREGDAHKSLAEMAAGKTPPFDLVFIDADKAGYPDYLHWALKLTRPGSILIADNVVREGRILEAENMEANLQGARRYLELLAGHKNIETTVIQTVGSKGYDGLAFSRIAG